MKGNNIVQNISNYFIEQKIIVCLSVLLLILLVVPFWVGTSLEIYDAPGHVGLVGYMKEYLWPEFSGWNPYFLSGWPQGIFYPSLFHWLSAILAFFVGIDVAIKLIISLAIIALPFSISYAVKNTIQNTEHQLPTTFLILLFLVFLPNFLGIGFRGLFQIGLIPNFVSTPILLVFIGLIHSQFKKGKYLMPAFLFAVLLLTHLVAAISAGFYLLICSLILYLKKELKIKYLILLIVISGLLTSFFWVPFLLNFSQTSVSAHVSSYFLPNLVLALIAFIFLILGLRNRQDGLIALSVFSLFFLIPAVLDSWLINNATGSALSNILYPFHVYRFQPYAYLALILAFGILLSEIDLLKRNFPFDFRFINTGLFLILLAFLIIRSPIISNASVTVNNQQLEGRFIESFRRTESDPLLYSAQTKLVIAGLENNPWAYGLFTDSTKNGPYLGSLVRSLRPEAYPEGEGENIETKFIDQRNVENALDLFGIKYMLNLGEASQGEEVGRWKKGGAEKVYSVEKVGEGSLAEVLGLEAIPVGSDFDKKVEEWWEKDGEWSTLPFLAESGVEDIVVDRFEPETKVSLVSHNENWTKMKLNIASEAPQPTLVKFSYFPWWKATSQGQSVPVYRAAPNLMLIFANGEVELEYKEPAWVSFLYLLSGVTLLAVLYMKYVKIRRF